MLIFHIQCQRPTSKGPLIDFELKMNKNDESFFFLDQLMFLPPNSSQISDEPEKVALKTILMWNGLGQWGGVRGGRYETSQIKTHSLYFIYYSKTFCSPL